ncbi:MAG TPA: EthD family reductase [Beijerinckiaceae bacterium]|nr:EthD family reductase [Beijerinckiaceae bacterium]
MARLVVMYKTPSDRAAFDKHYFESHVPLAKKIPGLRKYEVSGGPIASPTGGAVYHLVAILHFDDMAALQNAFASAEGQAAAADVQTFATGGVDMFMFDSRDV